MTLITMRVLVIEDDAFLRKAYEVSLRDHGFEVKVASDGESGLRMAERVQPDVILLDVLLPVLTGVEVLRRIKSSPVIADIPVVIFSVSSDADEIASILDLGASAYFSKSDIDLNSLAQRIRAIISGPA
ncbi:MAG TPA: response regulator [Candidatus Angelobacter sp.]|nr:response regulator [Candidatus Angelobacter sp.]